MSLKLVKKVGADSHGTRRTSFEWTASHLDVSLNDRELGAGTHPGYNPASESNRGRKQSLLIDVAKEVREQESTRMRNLNARNASSESESDTASATASPTPQDFGDSMARKLPFGYATMTSPANSDSITNNSSHAMIVAKMQQVMATSSAMVAASHPHVINPMATMQMLAAPFSGGRRMVVGSPSGMVSGPISVIQALPPPTLATTTR